MKGDSSSVQAREDLSAEGWSILSDWEESRPRVCEAWWMEAAVWSKATGVTNDSSVALTCDAALSRGCQVQPTSRRPGTSTGNELTQPHHQRLRAPSTGFLEQHACRLTPRTKTSPRKPHHTPRTDHGRHQDDHRAVLRRFHPGA